MGFFHHHHDEKAPENPPSYTPQPQANYAPYPQQQQQQQQQQQAPSSSAGPYPFSTLSTPQDPNFLIFNIADLGKGHDALVNPNHGPSNPAYRIEYTSDGFKCLRSYDGTNALAGSAVSRKQTTSTLSRIHLEYPWGKWDYNPLLGTELWKSDVGLLGGTSNMSWHLLKPAEAQTTGRFGVRCYDTSAQGYPMVASWEMENWDLGTLRVLAPIVRSQQQLDEIVVLSFAVMDYLRMVVRSTGGVQHRPGASTGGRNDAQFWMNMAIAQQAQNQQNGGW